MEGDKPGPKPDLTAALLALGVGTTAAPMPRSLLEPHLVENRVYKDTNLSLDGYTFRNCAFINCGLRTTKGSFHLESCYLTNCSVSFGGSAVRAVRLASLLLTDWNQFSEAFRAQVNPDGGITIL